MASSRADPPCFHRLPELLHTHRYEVPDPAQGFPDAFLETKALKAICIPHMDIAEYEYYGDRRQDHHIDLVVPEEVLADRSYELLFRKISFALRENLTAFSFFIKFPLCELIIIYISFLENLCVLELYMVF